MRYNLTNLEIIYKFYLHTSRVHIISINLLSIHGIKKCEMKIVCGVFWRVGLSVLLFKDWSSVVCVIFMSRNSGNFFLSLFLRLFDDICSQLGHTQLKRSSKLLIIRMTKECRAKPWAAFQKHHSIFRLILSVFRRLLDIHCLHYSGLFTINGIFFFHFLFFIIFLICQWRTGT